MGKKYKMRISIWCINGKEELEVCSNLYRQLENNDDYKNGDIMIKMTRSKTVDIYICDAAEIPDIQF